MCVCSCCFLWTPMIGKLEKGEFSFLRSFGRCYTAGKTCKDKARDAKRENFQLMRGQV